MITEKHLKQVCKIGQREKTCSFLLFGADGFSCAKGTSLEAVLEKRRQAREMVALSDNCTGPPDFITACVTRDD